MDFNLQEATVVNMKNQLRQAVKNEVVAQTAINLHPAGARAFFNINEAQQLLPIIFKLTKKHSEEVTRLMDRLYLLGDQSPQLEDSIEIQVNHLIQEWQNKMIKLGALPKGLWLLDFDSGNGYFCWKFPERQIQYWHHYQDGFSKRICVDKHLEHFC